MRIETALGLSIAVFLAIVAGIYWFTSYEDAGTTMLVLGAGAYALLGSYLLVNAIRLRRRHEARPEDLQDPPTPRSSEIVGYFPAASVWPAAMGFGTIVIGLGLVFGYWFFVIGGILFVGAVVGYAVEGEARP
jgi:Cytochrome c oxidase subunit IV